MKSRDEVFKEFHDNLTFEWKRCSHHRADYHEVEEAIENKAKSELIDIQIAELPEKKKWNQITGRDGHNKTEGYNQCRDEMKAKLLKQKGE